MQDEKKAEAVMLESMETYFDLMSMNGGVYVFQTARKMGFFDVLGNRPATAADVATSLKLKERPVKLLLDGLVALGLLHQKEQQYHPAPVLGFLQGNYQNLSADYWEHLPTLLRSGTPYKKMDSVQHSEDEYKLQVKALEWMMKPAATLAAHRLGFGTPKRKNCHIADFGAGAAVWSLAMLELDVTTRADALDWPQVLEVAKDAAQAAGLSNQFSTLPGDFFATPLEMHTYDMAVLGNVTHILTPQKNAELFTRVKHTLKPNGELVIFDVFSGQPKGNLAAALYALGLGIRTENGSVFTADELIEFLQAAGFSQFVVEPLEITPYTMGMIVAR